MRRPLTFAAILLSLVSISVGSPSQADDPIKREGEWTTYGRDFGHQRYSPLDQIDPSNVKTLKPEWIYQTGISATFQTSPLVSDGVMYVTTPLSNVAALDAKTGREIWRYDHKRTSEKLCCGPANRGAALGHGKVFVATVDARLVALDRATGKPVWDLKLAEKVLGATETKDTLSTDHRLQDRGVTGSTGAGANIAPLVYDGKVIVGITGVGYGLHLDGAQRNTPLGAVVGVAGKYGRPGFLGAYDAETGAEIWTFDTTQSGWEGKFTETTPDGLKLPRDINREKQDLAKYPDAWRYGGGSIWHTPAVDVETGIIYVGVGNPSPQAADQTRPGDNLYTVSLVALDSRTGKLVWHYQQVPHDMWGYDVASPPTLFDYQSSDGKIVPAVGQASKLGWYYVHDRRDGTLLFKSEAFVPQENLFAAPTADGIRITPGPAGGSNWSPASLNSATGVVYVAGMHIPMIYKSSPAIDGAPPYVTIEPSDEDNWGTLTALDLKNKGRILWQSKTDQPLVGGVLATAGNIVFTGEGDGRFSAFDATTGDRLWSFNCGAGVNAPPISYAIDGKQYVAVAAGGSKIWGYRQGDAVVVFALPGRVD